MEANLRKCLVRIRQTLRGKVILRVIPQRFTKVFAEIHEVFLLLFTKPKLFHIDSQIKQHRKSQSFSILRESL